MIDESSFNDFKIFLYQLAVERRQELMKCNTDCTGGWVVRLQLTLISQQAERLPWNQIAITVLEPLATESPCKILTLQNYVIHSI